ncbi:unnamed protein product (macronuclear) [Paramecium tetraurelia]|uniref:Glutamine cyclotransferase n=1 Tax=Paramecium tetraurelia TaxID=5888 RepID=A0CND9_PARTE|nr:uncharacterized protein GSPATT00008748001 [Paramecium tetraurelia]CAK72306.1 unnamed protein product [Paramecium tetraurelia]|eukprot:XP_001439703.1 hypothetical protein (macronuclear) [Paramecium tetraurelia strain d4-2]
MITSANSQLGIEGKFLQNKPTGSYQYLKRIYRDNTNNPQYTQGFTFLNEDTILESAGLYKKSGIHYFNLKNVNKLQNRQNLDDKYFGEGCDIINNKVYQLTWLERKIMVYEKEDLQYIGQIDLHPSIKEGWGLTHRVQNGETQILISDGTSKIHILNEDFELLKSIQILHVTIPTEYLNELEYANGILYANQYGKTHIYAIDLDKGKVLAKYNFANLVNEANRPDGCLNGIAFNQKTQTFWITGKNWPFIQEVKLN